MARLPIPGSDAGTWGGVLNDYLLQQHDISGGHDVFKILSPPLTANYVLLSEPLATKKVTWRLLDKSLLGLGNVDNTNDMVKPISTAQQIALSTKADKSEALAWAVALG